MKKYKIITLIFLTVISLFCLTSCAISEVSNEDAYNKYAEKVDLEKLRATKYLKVEVNLETKNADNTTEKYKTNFIMLDQFFYTESLNVNTNVVNKYYIKETDDGWVLYTQVNEGQVMSQLISDEEKDTIVSEMYNYIFPDEEIILPSSVESIEKTEVLVRGVTSVKIYFKVSENAEKDILNGDSVVTISNTGKIKEFTNTTDVYTISFKYTYPLVGPNYKPSDSDIPRLV